MQPRLPLGPPREPFPYTDRPTPCGAVFPEAAGQAPGTHPSSGVLWGALGSSLVDSSLLASSLVALLPEFGSVPLEPKRG